MAAVMFLPTMCPKAFFSLTESFSFTVLLVRLLLFFFRIGFEIELEGG